MLADQLIPEHDQYAEIAIYLETDCWRVWKVLHPIFVNNYTSELITWLKTDQKSPNNTIAAQKHKVKDSSWTIKTWFIAEDRAGITVWEQRQVTGVITLLMVPITGTNMREVPCVTSQLLIKTV